MSRPKLVHCLCPQRHLLMIARVSRELDNEQAIDVARQAVQEFLVGKRCICACGAPPEQWFCELVLEIVSVSTDAAFWPQGSMAGLPPRFMDWKRPQGLVSLN